MTAADLLRIAVVFKAENQRPGIVHERVFRNGLHDLESKHFEMEQHAACSLQAKCTRLKDTCVHSVMPCVTIGSKLWQQG